MSSKRTNVVIIGGGLAGLACARVLELARVDYIMVEASDQLGGRVATDQVDGFLLDRGFQVYLPAYPHAARFLDLEALDLKPFFSGALIRHANRTDRIADPWRHPLAAVRSALSAFQPADMLRIGLLRRSLLRGRHAARPGQTTIEYLEDLRFSPKAIERFFRPFFSGVFLETELATPATFFEFVFEMFARAGTALPAGGMGSVATQIADSLSSENILLRSPVRAIENGGVRLESGKRIGCATVVLACDASAARALSRDVSEVCWNAATTIYYAADRAPFEEPILMLGLESDGPITNLAVPSNVSRSYAPDGAALIGVTVAGSRALDGRTLNEAVDAQLERWFGDKARSWQKLATYTIPAALPRATENGTGPASTTTRLAANLHACGDYLSTPSIDGAIASGANAARAVLAEVAARPRMVEHEAVAGIG